MISSDSFKDRSRYPLIHIEKNKSSSIQTDINNFRINDSWAKSTDINKKEQPNNKFFYFRLSGLNLYYTNTKTDINILGAVSVKSIEKILPAQQDASTEYITTCLVINDVERKTFKICGLEEKVVTLWYCQMKTLLNESDDQICTKIGEDKTKTIIKTVEITQPIVLVPIASRHCNERWNYQNFGDDWECDCSEGKEQSPIDIPAITNTIETEVSPLFRYKAVKASDSLDTLDGKFLYIFLYFN